MEYQAGVRRIPVSRAGKYNLFKRIIGIKPQNKGN